MRTLLLQSRRDGRTCGHLHVRESGAWRSRDLQADTAAWWVVSTWLSDPDGVRPERNWGWIGACVGVFLLTGGTGAAALAGLAWFWMVGSAWLAAVAVVVAAGFGAMSAPAAREVIDACRNPSSSSGGWDWLRGPDCSGRAERPAGKRKAPGFGLAPSCVWAINIL